MTKSTTTFADKEIELCKLRIAKMEIACAHLDEAIRALRSGFMDATALEEKKAKLEASLASMTETKNALVNAWWEKHLK